MPEATVYPDHFSSRRKHQIGRAGKVAPMETKAIACAVQEAPDEKLRLRVLLPNPGH